MTYEQAQAAADKLNCNAKAELLSKYALCGQVIGGKFFPRRKIIAVLGLPSGRPHNAIAKRWVATVKV